MWDVAKENQLWDVDDFRARAQGGHGVIVIFDRVRDAPVAHEPTCHCVREDRFRQKMVEMAGKNGRYWWFGRRADAEHAVGARRCSFCG